MPAAVGMFAPALVVRVVSTSYIFTSTITSPGASIRPSITRFIVSRTSCGARTTMLPEATWVVACLTSKMLRATFAISLICSCVEPGR